MDEDSDTVRTCIQRESGYSRVELGLNIKFRAHRKNTFHRVNQLLTDHISVH